MSVTVETAGAPAEEADTGVILLHGRGASAAGMIQMADALPPDATYRAPEADQRTWYPKPFTAPLEQNQPKLNQALQIVAEQVAALKNAGIATEDIVISGFSQGACLALEFAARNPTQYRAIVAFSGGLIGPDTALSGHEGDLAGTPVFIGCDENDPHIAAQRVNDSAETLTVLGADVDKRLYSGIGHTVIEEEIEWLAAVIKTTDEA